MEGRNREGGEEERKETKAGDRNEGGGGGGSSVVGGMVTCHTLINKSVHFVFFPSPFITHAPLGLILVHDLTNRKSHGHLSKWLAEYYQSSRAFVSTSSSMTSKRHSTYTDSFQ